MVTNQSSRRPSSVSEEERPTEQPQRLPQSSSGQQRALVGTTTVVVVEDDTSYREKLCAALHAENGVEVVAVAEDGQEAVGLARRLAPQVVLMDIELGGVPNCIEAAKTIMARRRHPGVAIFSRHRERQYIAAPPCGEDAAWNSVLTHCARGQSILLRAIQGSARGLLIMDPAIPQRLTPEPGVWLGRLTPRKFDVLRLIASGSDNANIAQKLFISEKSVENVINRLYQGLKIPQNGQVHPRVLATLTYLEQTPAR